MPVHLSAWQQGATAASLGMLSADCPYNADEYDFVTWHNGWSFKRYLIAKGLQPYEMQRTIYANDEDF